MKEYTFKQDQLLMFARLIYDNRDYIYYQDEFSACSPAERILHYANQIISGPSDSDIIKAK